MNAPQNHLIRRFAQSAGVGLLVIAGAACQSPGSGSELVPAIEETPIPVVAAVEIARSATVESSSVTPVAEIVTPVIEPVVVDVVVPEIGSNMVPDADGNLVDWAVVGPISEADTGESD